MPMYAIPGMKRAKTPDGYELVSAASGMKVSVSDRAEEPKFFLTAPANPASDPISLAFEDWNELTTAVAEAWMIWVTTEIGIGFHPDTPASHYEPPLPTELAAEYDGMIIFCHENLYDPYEPGLDTMIKLGWNDGPLPETATGQAALRANRPA